ncbi:hypothetical protein Dacet_0963 [Denitrovibrio acetiphilus DSM 12809]|jgi:hypothetical protein|uniref:Uncharacterized protein n=1 Tax=Denitrovibrio acetiphilus (strain DSM 12809 / NBRC 114555 / N2460) TaxID=522772 RepID=D4H695_DENA2|nr:hypothetical protein [Denitrovibrio acetiphilus]ADD67741.1 hypothetical protein Dacet_0963 [Denitrovibrio acetiphilus DSM 12809]
MFKRIFKKEYKKLRYVVLGAFLLNVGLVVKMCLNTRAAFTLNPSVNVWLDIIEQNSLFFSSVSDVLQASAVIIGFMQFLPEVEKKRFRISCHLPVSEAGMIFAMTAAGIIFISAIALFDMACISAMGRVYFPEDINSAVTPIFFADFMGAVVLYIYAVVITLEPHKLRKAMLVVILFPLTGLFAGEGYRIYDGELIPFVFLMCLIVPIVLSPAYRFRKGDF